MIVRQLMAPMLPDGFAGDKPVGKSFLLDDSMLPLLMILKYEIHHYQESIQEARGIEDREEEEGEEEEAEKRKEATGWCQGSEAYCRFPLPLGPTHRV
ncbi:unnamed protein product [Strongylus vulgaris]|uniref:Uncharacterized protein n=1 Tax=Strongylus vulgaris TaxID=40348 RepID=A0A3P7KD99_STRVU|nr:unnamed protein product [Strongylus vulgaris]